MIYYFSGTGNSKYVAQRIAEALGETICDMATTDIKNTDFKSLGFVMPVYYWGIPNIVLDFLKDFRIDGKPYVYLVFTCGGSTGAAGKMFEKALGRKTDAQFSVVMPDTWTPMFDVSDKAKMKSILDAAEPKIDEIIAKIKSKAQGNFNRHKGFTLLTPLVYPSYKRQTTLNFTVSEDCIGCRLCEKLCPSNIISMKNGKPVWTAEKCAFCLGCLHRCPKFAIQFGGKTKKHGQFYNPRVK